MACLLTTKESVESAVLHALLVATQRNDLTADTSLEDPPPDGLGLNDYGKQMLYFPLENAIEAHGCEFDSLTPQPLRGASTISDLVTLVCKDLGIKTKTKKGA